MARPKSGRRLRRQQAMLTRVNEAMLARINDVPPSPPKAKRRRVRDGLIGLSSAAIVSIYALGYVYTRPAASQASAAEAAINDVTVSRPAPASAAATLTPNQPRSPSPTPAAGSSSQETGYRDGTYLGHGTSRHGDIQATVAIQGGRIVSAAVSRCGTQYSCSYVNVLTKEVVTRQAPPIHYVTGATNSSSAYMQAVTGALAQAR